MVLDSNDVTTTTFPTDAAPSPVASGSDGRGNLTFLPSGGGAPVVAWFTWVGDGTYCGFSADVTG